MSWLIISILSYFFFSLTSLGDKLVLTSVPKPKSYTFYTGISGLAVLILLPFFQFQLPSFSSWFWIIFEAFVYVLALYSMYSAVEKYEISRVATTLGALQPIFVFLITLIWKGNQIINKNIILVFFFLLIGNLFISFQKNIKFLDQSLYLFLTLVSAFLFALDYILQKIIFNLESFLLGFFWARLTSVLLVLTFLFKKNWHKEIFSQKTFLNKKTLLILIFTYSAGGLANFLQSSAISLAPTIFLPIVNALRGIQYLFLFIFTVLLSLFFPSLLKEELTKKIIFQKLIAIFLIIIGLAILSFSL